MSDRKIHLSDLDKDTVQQKKQWGFVKLLVVIICLGILFVNPLLSSLLLSLIPNSVVKLVISPAFQNVTLDNNPTPLNNPKKFQHNDNLPILGRDSGICFTFNNLDKIRKEKAKHGNEIAEIIAVDANKKEYPLDEVTIDEVNNQTTAVICQKFSRKSTILMPDIITAIYVRPIKPFTPNKIIWATKKDLYDTGAIK